MSLLIKIFLFLFHVHAASDPFLKESIELIKNVNINSDKTITDSSGSVSLKSDATMTVSDEKHQSSTSESIRDIFLKENKMEMIPEEESTAITSSQVQKYPFESSIDINYEHYPHLWEVIVELSDYFPLFLIVEIIDHDYDRALYDLYERVIDKLKISSREKTSLNFYSKDFGEKLESLLIGNRLLLPLSKFFYHDLRRLLFKWGIYIRQIIDNDPLEFDKMLKVIERIESIVNEKITLSYDLSLYHGSAILKESTTEEKEKKNIGTFMFKLLIKYEFIENFNIFFIFASAIKDFYLTRHFNCKQLRRKYFNGDFNNDILLKFLIIMHDPIGEMKKCFPVAEYLEFETFDHLHPSSSSSFSSSKNRNFNSFSSDDSSISTRKSILTLDYLENLAKKGPTDIVIDCMALVSSSIIKFFLKNNLKFVLLNKGECSDLIFKLKEEKFNDCDTFVKLVDFKSKT